MDEQLTTVEQIVPISFEYNEREPITARFTYQLTDPYAVTAVFTTREGDSEWTFARDLLSDGLLQPSGVGDVHVAPSGAGQLHLDLFSPEGSVRLSCDCTLITSFMDQVYALIPEGEEPSYVQMDTWLAELCA